MRTITTLLFTAALALLAGCATQQEVTEPKETSRTQRFDAASVFCSTFPGDPLCYDEDGRTCGASTPVPLRQLQDANAYINRTVTKRSDIRLFGVRDRLGPPRRYGPNQYGDCDEFVIAKRDWLVERGADPDSLAFIPVESNLSDSGVDHALLGYWPDGETTPALFLDDRYSKVMTLAEVKRHYRTLWLPEEINGCRVINGKWREVAF